LFENRARGDKQKERVKKHWEIEEEVFEERDITLDLGVHGRKNSLSEKGRERKFIKKKTTLHKAGGLACRKKREV